LPKNYNLDTPLKTRDILDLSNVNVNDMIHHVVYLFNMEMIANELYMSYLKCFLEEINNKKYKHKLQITIALTFMDNYVAL